METASPSRAVGQLEDTDGVANFVRIGDEAVLRKSHDRPRELFQVVSEDLGTVRGIDHINDTGKLAEWQEGTFADRDESSLRFDVHGIKDPAFVNLFAAAVSCHTP